MPGERSGFNPDALGPASLNQRAYRIGDSVRVMNGLVAWMQAHAQEIPAIDTSRPLLPQFDRLTNEQIRDAHRSMDPWAAKDSGSHRP